jgi:hypothetical protein
VCHINQKRKYEGSPGLELPQINAPAAPVYIIQRELPNIARAQAVAGRQQKDCVIPAAEGPRLVHRGQDAIDLCLAEHIRKVYMTILSRTWNRIAQRICHPSLNGCPAKEDAERRTIGAERAAVAGVLVELSNVPGRDATEVGHANAFQIPSERR